MEVGGWSSTAAGQNQKPDEERGAKAGGKEGQVEARWRVTPGSWHEDSTVRG